MSRINKIKDLIGVASFVLMCVSFMGSLWVDIENSTAITITFATIFLMSKAITYNGK